MKHQKNELKILVVTFFFLLWHALLKIAKLYNNQINKRTHETLEKSSISNNSYWNCCN